MRFSYFFTYEYHKYKVPYFYYPSQSWKFSPVSSRLQAPCCPVPFLKAARRGGFVHGEFTPSLWQFWMIHDDKMDKWWENYGKMMGKWWWSTRFGSLFQTLLESTDSIHSEVEIPMLIHFSSKAIIKRVIALWMKIVMLPSSSGDILLFSWCGAPR